MKTQISHLLNSKLAIIFLVFIAGYICVKNIIIPITSHSDPQLEAATMMSDEDFIETTPSEKNRSINLNNIVWQETPRRDPFNSHLKGKLNIIKHSNILNNQQGAAHHVPRISGLISGANSKLVVLNGKIVTEGQSIGKYHVIKINKDSVRLGSSYGYSQITLKMEP